MKRRGIGMTDLGLTPEIEARIRSRGWRYPAGVDEAGRGPLAGPVVAAAVILPPNSRLIGVDDSKKLSPGLRDRLYDEIFAMAIEVSVKAIGPELIDEMNILEASRKAMRDAVLALSCCDVALVDGLPVPSFPVEHLPLVGGDGRCLPIAAASIVAKVTRDRIMSALHAEYPVYGFDRHKGYGTRAHLEKLKEFGPCPEHRRSFRPVRLYSNRFHDE